MGYDSKVTWFFGLPGAGKTHLARSAAKEAGGIMVDSDEDGIRNGWPDTPLATHMLASRAFSRLPRQVFVASLMPLKHPWIRLIGVQCSEEVRRRRKPDYYANLERKVWHAQERVSQKSVDLFPGFEMAEKVIVTG